MNKSIAFLLILLMTGCKAIGLSASEITNLSDQPSQSSTPNLLTPVSFHDRRDARVLVMDEKIEDDAMVSLSSDAEIRASAHINVNAYNGIVLITGEVPTAALMSHITAIVQAVSDVRVVQNHMVLGYPTSVASQANDSLITAKIKAAFVADPRLPGFDTTRVKVVTENARVFLMGLVYKREGDIVADITTQQPNIREVIKVFEYL